MAPVRLAPLLGAPCHATPFLPILFFVLSTFLAVLLVHAGRSGVPGRGRTAAARAAHHSPQERFLFGEGSSFPADFRFAAAGSFLGMLDRLAAADTLVVYMDEMKQNRIHKH